MHLCVWVLIDQRVPRSYQEATSPFCQVLILAVLIRFGFQPMVSSFWQTYGNQMVLCPNKSAEAVTGVCNQEIVAYTQTCQPKINNPAMYVVSQCNTMHLCNVDLFVSFTLWLLWIFRWCLLTHTLLHVHHASVKAAYTHPSAACSAGAKC